MNNAQLNPNSQSTSTETVDCLDKIDSRRQLTASTVCGYSFKSIPI